MSDPLVVVLLAVACAVPLLATIVSTRTEEAGRARKVARTHAGVARRLGSVWVAFVSAAVFDRDPEHGHGRATYHVWTLGSRGPATVLVVFERPDDAGPWTQQAVRLREWIPFARPRELEGPGTPSSASR